MNRGLWYAVGAYGLWGVLPIYWKLLDHVPAIEILMHRTAWSFVFVGLIVVAKRDLGWIREAMRSRRTLLIYTAAALLLMVNWGVYIWGVNNGFIVETGLGYYINPLVSVVLGVVFLGERMRRLQWAAVGLAAVGVFYLTFRYGQPPWIALTLAFSFGFYGLLKKQAPLGAFRGLTIETAVLFFPAVGYLIWYELAGTAAFGHVDTTTTTLLAFTGVATAVPLLFFSAAALRVPLSVLGLMQYSAPTIQIAIGVFIYGEDFSGDRVVGFLIIWMALALYSGEGLWMRRQRRVLAAMEPPKRL